MASLCVAASSSAQAPTNTLRDDKPEPPLRPQTPRSAPVVATPSGTAAPAAQPSTATFIPSIAPGGGVVPTQAAGAPTSSLRINSAGNPPPTTIAPPPTARPQSAPAATALGSQLEIRRPAPTTPTATAAPRGIAPTAPGSGSGAMRFVPPTPTATGGKPNNSLTPTVIINSPPQPAETLPPPAIPAATTTAPAAVAVPVPVTIGGGADAPLVPNSAPPLPIGAANSTLPPPAAPQFGNQATSPQEALPGLPSGMSPSPQIALPAAAPNGALPPVPALNQPAGPAPVTAVDIEAIDFNGVTLGMTTLEEVAAAWGRPLEQAAEGSLTRCHYVIEPFAGVDVAFRDGRALSIIIDLGKKFPLAAVAQELDIGSLAPVLVENDRGQALGVVYPERGVSFRFAPDGERQVTQIGLDKIDPRPFVLRAEQNLMQHETAALADVEAALRLDPDSARAHWVKARLLSAAGRRSEALASAETALNHDPKGAEYLLTRAALLAEAGFYDAALDDGAVILNGTPGAPHLQARAWLLRGDLLAEGPARDYEQAIDAHTRAIRLAEPLVNDARPAVRRAAKSLLIDAHLAIANDVAWGNWQAKETTVPQWLSKAEKLCEAWIAGGDLSPEVRLTVCRKALAACVGVQGGVDPHAWATGLQERTAAALAASSDDVHRRRLQHEAGLGLYDALQAYHVRGDTAGALKCGETAVEYLTQSRAGRDESPTDPYMYGRLYFRIGSLYAVKRQDHAKAVEWFERAAPLLERPLPEAAAADRGRQGETLVSMGVSYWAVGKRERSLELTNSGSRYMQQAVTDGTLDEAALAVPYTNLSVMHRQLGDEAAGRKFHEMATRVEAPVGGLRR